MLEKEQFTQFRKEQLKKYNNNVVFDIEKKWGNLLYTPLDIPVIKDELFSEWYFENAKPIVKIRPDIVSAKTGQSDYMSVNVHNPNTNPVTSEKSSKWTLNIQQEWFLKFPKMYQQILDTLPYNNIPSINMWSSIGSINAHTDHSYFIDIPMSFRIMVHDENPNTTLYTGECLPDVPWDNNSRFYCKFPESTNAFVWNNLRTRHGSSHNPGYRKILLIVNGSNINWKKYDELLDRSVRKFGSEYCLTSKKNIDEFIIL